LLDLGEPKAILALALSPPNLDNIERNILTLKEVRTNRNKEHNLTSTGVSDGVQSYFLFMF